MRVSCDSSELEAATTRGMPGIKKLVAIAAKYGVTIKPRTG